MTAIPENIEAARFLFGAIKHAEILVRAREVCPLQGAIQGTGIWAIRPALDYFGSGSYPKTELQLLVDPEPPWLLRDDLNARTKLWGQRFSLHAWWWGSDWIGRLPEGKQTPPFEDVRAAYNPYYVVDHVVRALQAIDKNRATDQLNRLALSTLKKP